MLHFSQLLLARSQNNFRAALCEELFLHAKNTSLTFPTCFKQRPLLGYYCNFPTKVRSFAQNGSFACIFQVVESLSICSFLIKFSAFVVLQ